MAKGKKTVFFCQNCGHEESKWLGQCPACKEWNTFVEEKVTVSRGSTSAASEAGKERASKVVTLSSVSVEEDERIRTGIAELDRVLGGGIVQGSLVLVGGDPGIGKSTLLLQVCQRLSDAGKNVLYISGEESLKQIKLRADRMGRFSDSLYLLCETNLDLIRQTIERQKPDVVVIDSIQTMYNEEVDAALGAEEAKRRFGDKIQIMASGDYWVDFVDVHSGKGNALQKLCNRLGITKREEVVAFGDNCNDVSMLLEAGKSYAVTTAREEAKQAARYVLEKPGPDSVLNVLKMILEL